MDRKSNKDRTSESSDNESDDFEINNKNVKEKNAFKCDICSKHLKNIKTLRQHMQSHMSKRKCNLCSKSYTYLKDLRIHEKKVHGLQNERRQKLSSFNCGMCDKTYGKRHHLTRHISTSHQYTVPRRQHTAQFSCRHCDCEFQDYSELFHHINENHPLNQQGGRRATTPAGSIRESLPNQREKEIFDTTKDTSTLPASDTTENADDNQSQNDNRENSREVADESALANGVHTRYVQPRQSERYDVLTFFGNVRDQVRTFLQSRVNALGGIKWNLCVQVEMQRDDGQDVATATPYFRSRTYFSLTVDDFNEHNLNEAMQKMYASLEKFMREGSGWYVKKVLKLEIHTVVYKPIPGSKYIPLPKTLVKSNSLLNIKNNDDKCFLYSVLASLHPAATEPELAEKYRQYEHEVDMSGITFPVTLPEIRKFENQNRNISVNVFTYEDESILPLRITEQHNRTHHVNLLWLKRGDKSHYCLIKNLNRFLSRTKTHRGQTFFCSYCLHGFQRERSLSKHQQYCSSHGAQRVELPIPYENDILEFKDYGKTLKVPFVIYADFETINRKIHTCASNPRYSATTATTKLDVCSFGYKVVCEDDRYTKPTIIYRGADAGEKLIECLLREQEQIEEILETIEPMDVTEERDNFVENATQCCLCKKEFTVYDKTYSRIVRHHNHLTGEYIGPACNSCNINCEQAKFIPVLFHNLKNFDAHILCENLGCFKDHRLKCIAQNSERYVSFSLDKLRFIDSLQFLPASLESLVENLAQDGMEAFPHLLSECDTNEEATLLLRKGVYPYEYMDSFDKFEETELPPKEQFYSSIKQEHISDEDYEHAQNVFQTFDMTCLGEYHDLYLKTDVVLLSDVFESFRNVSLKQYELDPCHFYTSPGLSWSACLKMTGVRLELLSDIDQVLMIEAGIRGGVSQISNRYQKANNKYLPDYNPAQPEIYLQYLDANNLYSWSMVQPLPVSDFEFMDYRDIEHFNVMSVSEKGDEGYILEVSLEYPKSLHDSHNCFPLAPEKKNITNDQLSPYAQQLLKKLYGLSDEDPLPQRGDVKKLLTSLEDKDHYVIHYRNLQLYLRLGMKLKSIHRILRFKQEPWMKPYIDLNTEMRKKATSTFEKNFYKLLNVSVFGKTMENVRLHKNIELVHTEERLLKLTAKSTYKNSTIFNEDLVAVELLKAKVNLFKPIYCGMAILGK